jgi:hypothetical protein
MLIRVRRLVLKEYFTEVEGYKAHK